MGFTWTDGYQPLDATTPDDPDFEAKTGRELARLVAQAQTARRLVAHRPCADKGACRHCAAVRDTHRLIDDHLDQLETAALEAAVQQ